MKRTLWLLTLTLLPLMYVQAQHNQLGIPFFRNYLPADYNANTRNTDIATDAEGNVYVANFEGVLYYDHASWRILRLTDQNSPTALRRDHEGTLWIEGYKYTGFITIGTNGDLQLESADMSKLFVGIEPAKTDTLFLGRLENSVTHVLPISGGLRAVATMGKGLFLYDARGKLLCNVTEQNGLCSNNINRLAYDGKGLLWGATENGVFSMSIPSAYSRFGKTEGLLGEVYSIRKFEGTMYVGTTNGLYRQVGMQFEHVSGINHLCWALEQIGNRMLVASEGGLYMLDANGYARLLNSNATRALLLCDDLYYTGEDDGVFLNKLDGTRYNVSTQQNVIRILKDDKNVIWLQTLYGEIYCRKGNDPEFSRYINDINRNEDNTLVKSVLVEMGGKVLVVDALDKEPFRYSQLSYTDDDGLTWLSDKNFNNLYVWKDGKRFKDYDEMLYPFRQNDIRAICLERQHLWLGSELGVFVIDRSAAHDSLINRHPHLRICTVSVNGDSILWGGFGEQPSELGKLKNNENSLHFTFAIDSPSMLGDAFYQYRIDDNEWSIPSVNTYAYYNNQHSGKHIFQVKAIDAFGHETPVVSLRFHIEAPFYLQWYMFVFYIVLLSLIIWQLLRWRTKRLEREKLHLESIVGERTAEVVKQRDEIEEKSKRLEIALSELNEAQNELIRQEKMATVGKLTQGLIDRILNPLNYINNFSKLSQGLVKDVEANIEDEKEKMDKESYEDTKDVLKMLLDNLKKVSEHGQSTTRTLKAMEEMLKDRTGGIALMNLVMVIRQDEEMLRTYYAKEINEEHINVIFNYPATELNVNGNAEQLSKTFMSILANSVHALTKKAQREKYQPELIVNVKTDDTHIIMTFRDNGIGIEETIINKIFDPFFTTKPTGEASGVGLYLSREIIQNHQGDIHVKSVKNEYTEFTIVLPKMN